MIVVKEVKFNAEEFETIAKAAELIQTWRSGDDTDEVDNLMKKLVIDIYGSSRLSPDIDGWLEFIRTMLDELAGYMDEHEHDEADC